VGEHGHTMSKEQELRQEPTPINLSSPDGLQEIDGIPVHFYKLIFEPLEEGDRRREEYVGIYNPDGLNRLVTQGLEALEDGERLSFVGTFRVERDVNQWHTDIFRDDDCLVISNYSDLGFDQLNDSNTNPDSINKTVIDKVAVAKFVNKLQDELMEYELDPTLRFSECDDSIGEVVRSLGFSPDISSDAIRLPSADRLTQRIAELNQAGLQIPEIRFFSEGKISPDDYLRAWQDGMYPASAQPSWMLRDILENRWRPFLIFGSEAMIVPQLYARAIDELDSIPGNSLSTEDRTYVDDEFTGEDKINSAIDDIKEYATDLDVDLITQDVLFDISVDPSTITSETYDRIRSRPKKSELVSRMISVILRTQYGEDLKQSFRESGITALDSTSGEFSYDQYTKDLKACAVNRWGVSPQPHNVAWSDRACLQNSKNYRLFG